MRLSPESTIAATSDQVWCSLSDEAAILNTKRGIYYGLDPVGTEVWKLLQKPSTVADIHQALLREYDVQPDRCQRDLLNLLEDLLKAGLIELRT